MSKSMLCNQHSPEHKEEENVCLPKDKPLFERASYVTKIVFMVPYSDYNWDFTAKVYFFAILSPYPVFISSPPAIQYKLTLSVVYDTNFVALES